MRVRLREVLIDTYTTVSVPISVKFRTTSPDEDEIIVDLKRDIMDKLIEKFDYKMNNIIRPFLEDKKGEIEKNFSAEVSFEYSDLELEDYDNVLSSNGLIRFDVYTNMPVSDTNIRNVFNTLLNDALLNTEITIPFKTDKYGDFDIIAELNKEGSVEIGE